MKKFIILFLFVPFVMFGQINNDNFAFGVTHNIADLFLSAGDSMHFMGTFRMIDASGARFDSLGMNISANDSLNASVYGVMRFALTAAFSAGTVPGDTLAMKGLDIEAYKLSVSVNTTVSGIYYQWPAFIAATMNRPIPYIDIWVRVHAVGSEVSSSNKKFTVQITGHKRK